LPLTSIFCSEAWLPTENTAELPKHVCQPKASTQHDGGCQVGGAEVGQPGLPARAPLLRGDGLLFTKYWPASSTEIVMGFITCVPRLGAGQQQLNNIGALPGSKQSGRTARRKNMMSFIALALTRGKHRCRRERDPRLAD
jgi:hypothetical protein